MPSPSTLAYWEGIIIIAGFFGVVAWKLMTGEIDLEGLFDGDMREKQGAATPYVSAGRIQSFLVTIYVAFYYLMQVIHNPTKFPDVPNEMIGVLAGSHALYLGGKAQAMLLGRLRDLFK